MEFIELPLDEQIQKGISKAGYTTCTNVQEETYKKALNGIDVLVQSRTGTGKTAAFLIPVFQLLLGHERFKGGKALIVAPTRELAVQIEKEALLLGSFLPFNIACFYGGVGYVQQEKASKEGVDIIIGTPGRLLDFNESGKLPFSDVRILVIDEADRLFDMGFLPDLKRMLRKMPKREDRMTMLFSATLGLRVTQLAWDYMNEPVEIMLSPDSVTVDEITQELYHVTKSERMKLLLGVLKREAPESVLIFTNMKHEAVEVSRRLELNGYQSRFIIGDLPQKKRQAVIDSIKAGKLKVLVATDVAARGLHIQDLQLVVNYDLPEDSENYVHRIGRTARAGKTGKAISLACENCVYNLEGIEKLLGKKIPVSWADQTLYAEDSSVGSEILRHHNARDPVQRSGGRYGRTRSGERSYAGGEKPVRSERGGYGKTGTPSRPAGERFKGENRSDKPYRGERVAKPHAPERYAKGPRESAEVPGKERTAGDVKRREGIPSRDKKPGTAQSGKPAGRPAQEKPYDKSAPSQKERMEYYRSKYGEEFKPSEASKKPDAVKKAEAPKEVKTESGKKQGLFSRLLGIFTGRN